MRATLIVFCTAVSISMSAWASGPADRVATDPQSLLSAARSGSGPVSVDALLKTTRIGDVAISLDGHQLAYTSNASGRVNLWLMNIDGSGAHQLVTSNDRQTDAAFTHDGSEIVFAQDTGGDELYDLYAVAVAGGTPRNLTHTDTVSETSPHFSPDGRSVVFGSKPKASAMTDLAVMDWPSGKVRALTHESDPKASWFAACWSPDGRFIYAVRAVGIDDSDIFRIDAHSGAAEKLLSHTGKQLVSVSDVSPDGRTLLITSNSKGGYENVALLDIASRKLQWVTDTQWAANADSFSRDGKTFTYTLNADGRVTTQFVDVATLKGSERGVPIGLNFPAGSPRPFLPDGSVLLSHEDSTHPAELYLLHPDNRMQQITHNESAELEAAVVPSSQLVTYKSFDGRLISAFAWVPFNLKRDGTAAAVVMPHGGPTGQVVDSFNSRAILLASRGFVVIAPNVRGSTGYGMDFQNANIKDLGGADLKDEVAGVEFLKSSGYIDPKRVGIWGGSYGGFMTLMAIGKTPEIWSAAVDEYGILDWFTMLQHEDPRLQEYEKSLLGDPVKDRSIYEASSPLKYIRDEKAPLLVLQGERDIRVPREEAEQVVTILKGEGRTVDAVFYPEEGHGFIKREHQHDELTRAVDWLQRYLQPGSSGTAAK